MEVYLNYLNITFTIVENALNASLNISVYIVKTQIWDTIMIKWNVKIRIEKH